ncbi:hypothetical protein PENANT_c006G07748 [Penicillium antarcticum]|uniref:BZIP domain-containing protein n=1 Tax=Penicillium antarcticum TaxID=416450 RepID=A0A1V6QDL3_9EURO|nr:hypothetical protein PENANT_c006G07748 [Penicillium antarcticum]
MAPTAEIDQHDVAFSNRPKRRIITPARQEQNRIAQRAYRERQKERRNQSNAQSGRKRKLAPQPPSDVSELLSSRSPDTSSESTLFTPSKSLTRRPAVNRAGSSPSPPIESLMNALQTPHDTMWIAILNNALCLGFDVGRLAACSMTYVSPFFKSISAQDSAQDLVVSTFNSSIPIHLQPTMAQILVPHHASLDLIPMPLLRERAIMMCYAMPHAYSLWDFKLDIYTRHALICHRYRPDSDCQSWDPRSWEGMPWFLKKWSTATAVEE